MLGSMTPELHRQFENYSPYEMLQELKSMFEKQAGVESNGIYEMDMHDLVPNVNSIYNVSTIRAKHNLDSTYLWHCRLAHISKKRIEKLQQERVLRSIDDKSFDQCVSCLSGKMTRKSFPHRPEKATDLFGTIHTDVCGPLRHVSRQGASYFITFTDDYSRYGYVYLLKLKHEDYALESVTHILNMIPTKKVNKNPYELCERAIDLKEIQDEDTSPSEIGSKIPMEVEVEEHSLGDLNEPASYKAAMLDLESNKWIDAMNAKIQSMIDNMVWVLVDLPLGCKTFGSKWIFKKKNDMDGIVHTYKALLVAKGYIQLYGVNYEETFSPVADIKAISILISIAALKQLIGLGQNSYMDKILKRYKMDNSKRGHIPMQERLDLNKEQGASTPKENPSELHWTAVENSLKYLKNTKDMLLVYGGNPKAELRVDCYCNAGFETDINDMKSLIGYVLF
nr:hypothetical protein [Tanacetum cinerariifolium]